MKILRFRIKIFVVIAALFLLTVGSASELKEFGVFSGEVTVEQPELKLGFDKSNLVWLPNESLSETVVSNSENFSKNFDSALDWYKLNATLNVNSQVVDNITNAEFSAGSNSCNISVSSTESGCGISSVEGAESFSLKFNLSTQNVTIDKTSSLTLERGGG